MTAFSETLDYFSPSGVPLRSKVSITITEQDFRYQVEPSPDQPVRQGDVANDANRIGRRNGVDSLDDLLEGTGFNLALGMDAQLEANVSLSLGVEAGIDVNLGASLGLSADFDLDLRAGVDLGVSAAADVFGIDAVVGIGGTARAGVAMTPARAGFAAPPITASMPPTVWAPQGLPAGSRAVDTARAVVEARQHGDADRVRPAGFQRDTDVTVAPTLPGNRAPVPVRGTPPIRVPAFGEAEATVYARDRIGGPLASSLSGHRPRWETLTGERRAAPRATACTCGCGSSGGCGCGRS